MPEMMLHHYRNLPLDVPGWKAVVEPAKDAYWQARREGKNETDALLAAIDAAMGVVEGVET